MIEQEKQLHDIVKNLDYSLRINKSKFVLVASDNSREGKSTFLAKCTPILASIYEKKILIYDCQPERDDILELALKSSNKNQFINNSNVKGLDYLHQDDLTFISMVEQEQKWALVANHFSEISKEYDVVFINMKTLKRSDKTVLPVLPIDGAILIRTDKNNTKSITSELLDREIPIIGIIKNDGV